VCLGKEHGCLSPFLLNSLRKQNLKKEFKPKEVMGMQFYRRETAQGMVEYSLIIVMVALVLILVLTLLGSQISTVFSSLISGLKYNG
jgi:pilus assembly protein Flp/PilA